MDEDDIDGIPIQDVESERPSRQQEILDIPANGASLQTRLDNSNKGFRMLSRLGWHEGDPLGLSPEGDPFSHYLSLLEQ